MAKESGKNNVQFIVFNWDPDSGTFCLIIPLYLKLFHPSLFVSQSRKRVIWTEASELEPDNN